MSRAQFDSEQVIENAMQVFWQRGYSGASMQDVTKTTGLKPGSIYLAFGNKEGLYRASLEHYAKQKLDLINTVINSSDNVAKGICHLFDKIIEESVCESFSSCFLVRSRLELPKTSPLHKYAGDLLLEVEDYFAEKLSSQFDQEQAKTYAAILMIHIFGARVYGYNHPSRATLRKTLSASLPWLPWDEFYGKS